MLLHRGPRRGWISRDKLARRFEVFARGEWNELLNANRVCDEQTTTKRRGSRRASDEEKRGALRALVLAQVGELSSSSRSGTTDHLRPLLKSHQDTQLMYKLAGRFACLTTSLLQSIWDT